MDHSKGNKKPQYPDGLTAGDFLGKHTNPPFVAWNLIKFPGFKKKAPQRQTLKVMKKIH